MILSHTPSCSCKKRKEKKRKRKRNINNDLAVLPSHDTTPLLSFLVPRNFSTTCNMGPPCCLFHLYLPLSILVLLIFLLQLLLGLSSSSLFLLVSCPFIASNFSLIFPNIPGYIVCLTIHITSLLWTSLVILRAWTSFPRCHDLAKRLSHYLYFFSFLFFFFFFGLTTTRWGVGKYHVTLSQYHNGVTDGHGWSRHKSQSQGVTWLE